MGSLFRDLTAGFSSFVLAWLVPSVLFVAAISLFVYPELASSGALVGPWAESIETFVASGPLAATAVFALAVLAVALLSSLSSRPLYRMLEGYTLPSGLQRRLLRRQVRRLRRLRALSSRGPVVDLQRRGLAREQLRSYPISRRHLMPTRLGNALKAMETYSNDHYVLDLQSMYYEIYAAAPESCRRDADNARSSVDFFISLVGLLGLLSAVSTACAVVARSPSCLLVAAIALTLTWPAYNVAVQNMTDWSYAMQAIVNTGRTDLAASLGYRLPDTLDRERTFWRAWNLFVARSESTELRALDQYRQSQSPTGSGTSDVPA